MKVLTKKDFDEIRLWVYRNGRQMEIALWNYELENGGADAVLDALALYQNADGGFGNALEPDNWNPNSSPYPTLHAIGILDQIGFRDAGHPIIRGIIRYLESGAHSDENGWLFNIPSNNDYPHAPWWTYDPEANKTESRGVVTGIAGFILKHAEKGSSLYQKALSLTEKAFAEIANVTNYGEMGVGGLISLREMVIDLGMEDRFDIQSISPVIHKLVNEGIERDSAKWVFHCKRPTDFIASPDSEFYKGNEDIVEKQLDWLIDTRHEHGVWDITWSWFGNNEKYAKEFAITENWWKANGARETVGLLKRFERVAF